MERRKASRHFFGDLLRLCGCDPNFRTRLVWSSDRQALNPKWRPEGACFMGPYWGFKHHLECVYGCDERPFGPSPKAQYA